ncbi:hypothetical protein VZT92_012560 [Zoarces viviparus]|uniref:Uncharacterized protein n=1 Tax=Zoarces viviparus TaxID=48416 RepID=A0AAW1F1E8_ZOAVI
MPRNYTRKTTWGQTPLAEMESAAAEVMQGKKSLRKAGGDRNIDKTTLKRFIKKKEKGEEKSGLAKKIIDSSSEESDVPVPLDDDNNKESSEDERSDPGNTDLSVGNFVQVNFATKHRSLRYGWKVE